MGQHVIAVDGRGVELAGRLFGPMPHLVADRPNLEAIGQHAEGAGAWRCCHTSPRPMTPMRKLHRGLLGYEERIVPEFLQRRPPASDTGSRSLPSATAVEARCLCNTLLDYIGQAVGNSTARLRKFLNYQHLRLSVAVKRTASGIVPLLCACLFMPEGVQKYPGYFIVNSCPNPLAYCCQRLN